MKIDMQELYEDILSYYWQKIYQLDELISTNTGNGLRQKSINDRKKEFIKIKDKRLCFELLFSEEIEDNKIIIPNWYIEKDLYIKTKIKEFNL